MRPSEYYTFERVMARTLEDVPEVLFHWTRSLDLALKILADGVLKGRPTVSTSENPAFGTPGPVVFVFSPGSLLRRGFTLWPYLWQRGAEREAEWVIASSDAEFQDRRYGTIISEPIQVPVEGTVRMIGYPGSWVNRRNADVRSLREAARPHGIPVRPFLWEEWWANGVVIP